MTRMERRRRRQWAVCITIVALAVEAWITALLVIKPWHKEEVTRTPVNPPYVGVVVHIDHPQRVPQYDVPLDNYQQQILWDACQEWGVPYELALAVCWRETQYQNLVTELPSGTYYGMMAVDIEDAGYYMELCGVDNLDTEENRLRVGCCILGQHLKNEGSVEAALCRYSNDYEGWYAADVLRYMEDLK